MITLLQSDVRWKNRTFPGAAQGITFGMYGCWATCICMILDKDPNQLMDENPTGWTLDGNMNTDAILKKYGLVMKKTTLVKGQPLPKVDKPVVLRTTYYNERDVNGRLLSGLKYKNGKDMAFPTHFFIYNPDGTFTNPAFGNNPVIAPRYVPYVNEMRELVKVQSVNTQKCQVCGK